jgi:N-methylhydantoinase B/oxoprolinase/acetone carboxylase alpha subunit
VNLLMMPAGNTGQFKRVRLESKASFEALAGSVLRIETPGGGGWGKPQGSNGRHK